MIRARLAAKPAPAPFRYSHQGSLATIGQSAAIIDFGRIKLKGWIAWWIWGIAHIYFLIGTRSRFAVAWSWLWIYLSGQHSARLDNSEGNDARRQSHIAKGGSRPLLKAALCVCQAASEAMSMTKR